MIVGELQVVNEWKRENTGCNSVRLKATEGHGGAKKGEGDAVDMFTDRGNLIQVHARQV